MRVIPPTTVAAMLIVCPSCTSSFRISADALGTEGRTVRCGQCRNVWHATPADAVPEPVAAQPEPPPPPAENPSVANTTASPPLDPDLDADNWGAAFAEEDASKAKAPTDEPEVAAANAAKADGEAGDNATAPEPSEETREAVPLAELQRMDSPALVPADNVEAMAIRRARRPLAPRAKPKRTPLKVSIPVVVIILGMIAISAFMSKREAIVRMVPGAANVYEALGLHVNLRGLEFQNMSTTREIQDGIPVLIIEGRIANLTTKSVDVPRLRFSVRDNSGREIYNWTAQPQKSLLGPGEEFGFRSRLASPPQDGKDVMVRFFTPQDVGN